MSVGWRLESTYAELPEAFHSKLPPVAVLGPKVVILNRPLAEALGLNVEALEREAAAALSGNSLPDGAVPLAQAYAGHQFGYFTMLGDGRAILLGEQIDPQGRRWDIQLKGSGRTPYSRRGDGRAALGPMLREYLISEAMFALGIPTTRSLAVISTGEPVYRETLLPGAILTRIAASHIRVGTFEYAATQSPEIVRQLADYTIQRHYPEIRTAENPYESLLQQVISRQAELIASWMLVGFVHGVMNTDNMTISGETIDYGPCAFMDHYDPGTVFSSIDRNGRYAYGNQPTIAQWNLTRFAESLLPLIHSDEETAIQIAKKSLERFEDGFFEHWKKGMRNKLGLFGESSEDQVLIQDLLKWMQENRLDYTNTFRSVASGQAPRRDSGESLDSDPAWKEWQSRWQARLSSEGRSFEESRALMRRSSPNVIPRNHHVEAALAAAVENDDLAPFEKFLAALQNPYEDRPEHLPYLESDPTGGESYRTFCGT